MSKIPRKRITGQGNAMTPDIGLGNWMYQRASRTPLRLATDPEARLGLFQWPLRILQKLFITAIFLPLALLGAGILFSQRQFKTLAILLAVPCYYFATQSALHTEYRYVLVIHYFLFVLAAAALYTIAGRVTRLLRLNKERG